LADASARAMAEPQLLATLAEQGMFADLRIGDVAASAYVKSEAQRWKPVVANLDLKKQ
jgi:hypothetical protein